MSSNANGQNLQRGNMKSKKPKRYRRMKNVKWVERVQPCGSDERIEKRGGDWESEQKCRFGERRKTENPYVIFFIIRMVDPLHGTASRIIVSTASY